MFGIAPSVLEGMYLIFGSINTGTQISVAGRHRCKIVLSLGWYQAKLFWRLLSQHRLPKGLPKGKGLEETVWTLGKLGALQRCCRVGLDGGAWGGSPGVSRYRRAASGGIWGRCRSTRAPDTRTNVVPGSAVVQRFFASHPQGHAGTGQRTGRSGLRNT